MKANIHTFKVVVISGLAAYPTSSQQSDNNRREMFAYVNGYNDPSTPLPPSQHSMTILSSHRTTVSFFSDHALCPSVFIACNRHSKLLLSRFIQSKNDKKSNGEGAVSVR